MNGVLEPASLHCATYAACPITVALFALPNSMNVTLNDTIAAIASAAGPAERGIIRITGAATGKAIQDLLPIANSDRQTIRQATHAVRLVTKLRLPALSSDLPVTLMWWPTSKSFTGQPMAEIHMLGSAPLMDAVLERIFQLDVRAANRGEFTLRAFLTGRIDLVQAEAVLGVIDAADHQELETALTQLGGAVTESLRSVRDSILSLLGDLEAGLDFVEEDIEFVSKTVLSERLQHCMVLLTNLDDQSEHRLPSGRNLKVVFAGLPNAGKSTLFNALAGEPKAIVSDVAGTTRDYLSVTIDSGKLSVEIIDTAGWEFANDNMMQQAQNLRRVTIKECDLVVWCQAADLTVADQVVNQKLRDEVSQNSVPVLDVMTRCDLKPSTEHDQFDAGEIAVRVSFPTDQISQTVSVRSVETILQAIYETLQQQQSTKSELLGSTAVRCRDSLKRTIRSLQSASQAANADAGDEIISLELRDALQQLSTILGEVYTDDILDHIFSNFCIGK